MPSFRSGDLFTVTLADDVTVTGRVLLDVHEQALKRRRLPDPSPLMFFKKSVLVEIFAELNDPASAPAGEVLIPSVFTNKAALEAGTWPVIDHLPVDARIVSFPEVLLSAGRATHFVTGEVSIPIALSFEEVHQMQVYGSVVGSAVLEQSCLYHLDMVDKMRQPFIGNPQAQSQAHNDLRFSEHRARIYELLASDASENYFDLSLRHGRDIRRFYETGIPARAFVGCPFCIRPVGKRDKVCRCCGADLTRDALVDISAEEIVEGRRKNCVSCEAVLFELALRCPECRAQQS